MSRFLLQNLDDWIAFAARENPRPEYDPLHPRKDDLTRIIEYNARVGLVATHDTKLVSTAIARAQQRNERAVLNGQQCVLISGRPLDGKTHAAVAHALNQCRAAWAKRPPAPRQTLLAPWGYLEVEAGHGLKGMATSLLEFIGAPVPGRGSGSDLMHQLRRLLPAVGMRGVIVDDAHGIVGAHNAASRAFAGALKAMITGLPVTLVIVGVRLNDSALGGTRGDEVRLRVQMVTSGQWPAPFCRRQPGPWERLVANMSALLELPGEDARAGMRHREFVTTLATGSDGRPGLAIEWLKEAAEYAITRGLPLDVTAMARTQTYVSDRLQEAATSRRYGQYLWMWVSRNWLFASGHLVGFVGLLDEFALFDSPPRLPGSTSPH